MARLGRQTWDLQSTPVYVEGVGTVAGTLEGEGPLGGDFDIVLDNDRIGGDTWEHSEQMMFAKAAQRAMNDANVSTEQVNAFIGADLNAQLTGFYLGTRAFAFPALGVYSACASICEGLAMAGLLVHTGHAQKVLVGTSSHASTAERQFRYPTEYGAQKPPTAQRTVTGSGVAVIGNAHRSLQITHATIGRVMDYGIASPWEMGAAMAPAAFSTIDQHLTDTGRTLDDYDLVASGDLGHVGLSLLKQLLGERGHSSSTLTRVTDCGAMIYASAQPEVFSGGSGGACCTIVTFGHLFKKLMDGTYRRILVSATGALLSAVSVQQKDTIPSISHAIAIERKDG